MRFLQISAELPKTQQEVINFYQVLQLNIKTEL
jgi:hypothetical protein